MVVFPNAKINLGLNILRKRNDGFHDIETVFFPVPLQDCLEVITSGDAQVPFLFSSSGLPIDGDEAHNLCVKAFHLLKKDFPQLPSLTMHLHKAIPMGAGMGGGSADGAFALQLINDKYRLGLSQEKLIDYALQLGSDGPFFILNRPCFAGGRGEVLTPIDTGLSTYSIVLVCPGIHINTGWAFSQLQPSIPSSRIPEIIKSLPVEEWKDKLVNDFERPVFKAHPALQHIKETLYQQGAVYAAMSGSGSTVYGLFKKDTTISTENFKGYSVYTITNE